jgi:hypothetical protein
MTDLTSQRGCRGFKSHHPLFFMRFARGGTRTLIVDWLAGGTGGATSAESQEQLGTIVRISK